VKSGSQAAQYLVAHRGDRAGGIENTLAGFAFAAEAGARFAECDIQFSRDLVPLVIHDNHLTRLCHRPHVRVSHTSAEKLRRICRRHFSLPTLTELLDWLHSQPQLTLFVEIKPPVRNRLTDRTIARRIHAALPEGLLPQIVLISQSAGLIDACAEETGCALGWVALGARQPQVPLQYVFMDSRRAAGMGSWKERGIKVALYTVNDAQAAAAFRQAGADLIETNLFSRMLREL
jgi:glycerophosphoryl diester phosphodiesterase